jgi:hypothetical protein
MQNEEFGNDMYCDITQQLLYAQHKHQTTGWSQTHSTCTCALNSHQPAETTFRATENLLQVPGI